MIQSWDQTPNWQRFVIFGLTMLLFVVGMQTWVWDSLDDSIIKLDQDIAELTQQNQESMQSMALLHGVEQEVVSLREKFTPLHPQRSRSVEPKAFRKDVVSIGKRTGVVVRLWNPQQSLSHTQPSDASLDIVVKVEGSFYDTVQFINDVLQLPWVQTVNPMMLARIEDKRNVSIVVTDFTIKGFVSKDIQGTNELLKT